MAVDAPVDVELLKREIRKTYACVSQEPDRDFIFPTGRAWAEALGYPPELSRVPDLADESFAGVANHWEHGRLEPGQHVLDVGCGAGTDTLVAALMVGPEGRVVGLDMTAEMLAKARAAAAAALARVSAKSGATSRARASNNRTAAVAATSSTAGTTARSGSPSGSTGNSCSPRRWSGVRLVASTVSLGQAGSSSAKTVVSASRNS